MKAQHNSLSKMKQLIRLDRKEVCMIYYCDRCKRFVYAHEIIETDRCPYCKGVLDITDEDEQ